MNTLPPLSNAIESATPVEWDRRIKYREAQRGLAFCLKCAAAYLGVMLLAMMVSQVLYRAQFVTFAAAVALAVCSIRASVHLTNYVKYRKP